MSIIRPGQVTTTEVGSGAVKKGSEGTRVDKSAQSPQKGSSADTQAVGVELSDGARVRAEEMRKAFDIAKATPEIRQSKVEDLRRQVELGTYQVNPEGIADGILKEAIVDRVAQMSRKKN